MSCGFIAVLLFCGLAPAVRAADAVTLQLKRTHTFQFAGYYAAKEKGYYREAGLDVDIRESQPGSDPLNNVLEGKAQYGVGDSSLLLARKAGQPVVALAAIFQHSPLVLIARQIRPAQGIHDLVGRRVTIAPQADELVAYLKQEDIPLTRVDRLEHSLKLKDLVDGEVDAVSSSITNEPYYLDLIGFAYHVYTPRSAGIDFYGDSLFTTERELNRHPDRVAAFRKASLRGWKYAMEHPEEIADLIVAKYSKEHAREFYLHEAKHMAPLMQTDLIEIGYMNPGRWRHIADTYANLGMLPGSFSLDGFLYEPDAEFDLTWFYLALGGLAFVSVFAFYIFRINRRLAGMIIESERAKAKLAESEAQFRVLANTAAAGVFVLQGTRFFVVNPAFLAISGYTEQELLSLDLIDLVHSDHRQMVMVNAEARQQGKAAPVRYEFKLVTKQGDTRWVELTAGSISLHGRISIIGTIYDMTERRQMAEALRLSEERHRLLADNASDVIWILDKQGRLTYVSPSVEKLSGFFVEEVMPMSLDQIMTSDAMVVARKQVARTIEAIHAGQPIPDFRGELELLRKDGSTVWAEVSVNAMYNADGEFISLLGVTRDISERKQNEERLRQMAQHDFLTGLPNRDLFSDRLQQALADCRRHGRRLGLMFLDLDKFKSINDTLGHAVGDLVLREAALRMQGCVRESDTVARIGGDEFVVLMRSIGTDESALLVAEKLRLALDQPFDFDGRSLSISASIGIALYPDHGGNEVELIKSADSAMYRAKNNGRDNVQMAQSV
jgi:diguanylate cyclase (GGDEF)-like protein/PAS domain S-box-containing protein